MSLFGGGSGLSGLLGGGSSGASGQYCFVFARGSTEPGGLGILIGPYLERQLKRKLPGLVTIPVQYAASISTNISIARTDPASIRAGNQAFEKAGQQCQVILASGYSQGGAVMGNVIPKLPENIKSKIAGVVLWGSTRNLQDRGGIPTLDKSKVKAFCNLTDGVCTGQLLVTAGHLSYSNSQIAEAADFLAQKAQSAGGGKTN